MSFMTNSDTGETREVRKDSFGLDSGSLLSRVPKNSIFGNVRATLIWLLLTLLFSGAIGTSAIVFIYSSTSSLTNHIAPLDGANDDLLISTLSARSATKSFLTTGNDAFITAFNDSVKSFNHEYAIAKKLASFSGEHSAILQKENQAAQAAFSFCNTTIANDYAGSASLNDASHLFLLVDSKFKTFDTLNSKTASLLQNDAVSARKTAQRVAISAEVITVLFTLAGLFLGYKRAERTHQHIALLLDKLKATLGLMGGDRRRRGHSDRDTSEISEEQELVSAINAIAAQNQNLLEEMELQVAHERELREGLEHERSLRETLSRTLYRDLDAASALQRTIDGFGASLRADRAIVRAIENGVPGEIVAKWNSPSVKEVKFEAASEQLVDESREIIYGESGLFAQSIKSGKALVVNDIGQDQRISPELRERILRTGLVAILSVPVMGAGGAEALLMAQIVGRARSWTERDIEVAETMAGGLAATLAAVRLYEQERSNVASMRELDAAKDDFLSSVSHELRTPLTSIVGYLELLQDEVREGNLASKYSRMLDAIDRNSQRLLSLIDNILTASRIDSNKLDLNLTKFHISTLLIRVVETAMPQIRAKNIDLRINIYDRVPDISGDIGLLERAVLNLISNATKFCNNGGVIDVAVYLDGEFISLAVRDSGIGIPPNEIDNLFTRFFRATTAKDNAVQGTGLGLVIVKAIMERHGGSISVTSEPGAWTEFKLSLPC